MNIHHIGYLVDNIEVAEAEFATLGFNRIGEIVEDHAREVKIMFLDNGGSVVELIQSIKETSPVYRLHKKVGNSPYHICYETNNIQSKIEDLTKNNGVTILLYPPSPAPAISGSPNVAFLLNRHIGVIELVEHLTND